ncbi:hypothetical protein, partial [Corynebacterium sp. HMSC074C04]|uniref:hypothetical protein n=1 Tax=Corynebacterium sp. HMSC074C04 TaxID=1739514 RepID=UPI001AEFA726
MPIQHREHFCVSYLRNVITPIARTINRTDTDFLPNRYAPPAFRHPDTIRKHHSPAKMSESYKTLEDSAPLAKTE